MLDICGVVQGLALSAATGQVREITFFQLNPARIGYVSCWFFSPFISSMVLSTNAHFPAKTRSCRQGGAPRFPSPPPPPTSAAGCASVARCHASECPGFGATAMAMAPSGRMQRDIGQETTHMHCIGGLEEILSREGAAITTRLRAMGGTRR